MHHLDHLDHRDHRDHLVDQHLDQYYGDAIDDDAEEEI